MSLRDEVAENEELDEIERLEKLLTRKTALADTRKSEIDRLRREQEGRNVELDELKKMLGVIEDVTESNPKIPKWVSPKKPSSHHVGQPTLILSDLHFDEVVDLGAMEGINEYNREIATRRLTKVIDGTVDVAKNYINNIEYEGMILMLGGDILTGDIHEELAKTNEGPVADSVVYWVGQLAGAIAHLADEFGQVFVPCVRGNHDRYGKKKQHKQQSQEAFTWIIYHWLQDHFAGDDRVEFAISPSSDFHFTSYNTRYLLTHGDQFRGGNGIAGIFSPIMRGAAKKQQRNASLDRPFDYVIMGHFHQLIFGNEIVVNGSLKGYDEYAYDMNFAYEPPRQAFWITTPERGITFPTAIYADDHS